MIPFMYSKLLQCLLLALTKGICCFEVCAIDNSDWIKESRWKEEEIRIGLRREKIQLSYQSSELYFWVWWRKSIKHVQNYSEIVKELIMNTSVRNRQQPSMAKLEKQEGFLSFYYFIPFLRACYVCVYAYVHILLIKLFSLI